MKEWMKHYLLFLLALVTLIAIATYLLWCDMVTGSYETGREIHYYMTDERLAAMNEIRISDYKSMMK